MVVYFRRNKKNIMKTELFIYMQVIHFLADFALQTSDQAKYKSENNRMLLYHVLTYSVVWFLAVYIVFGNHTDAFIFAVITFICHFITDYCTSRIGKPFWEAKDYHNGFVVVGFDQMLHFLQLYYTFAFVFNL
jgi:hypothetical protein